jgi:hypothetical protein
VVSSGQIWRIEVSIIARLNPRFGLTRALAAALVIFAGLDSLAPRTCQAQGIMYACESGRQFYSINLNTGAKTLLGNISAGNSTTGSLAYDCETATTYLSATGALAGQPRNLYILNVTTRQTTIVGPYTNPGILMHGIEIDNRTSSLYGVSTLDQGFYAISRSNGAETLVGFTGIPVNPTSFNALGYDSDNGVLYMINTGTDSLYRINVATGAATLVGPTNATGCGAMAYNIDNHTMYMVDNDADILYTVNLTTGQATAVGSTGVGNLIGLVYVTPTCPPPPSVPGDVNGDGAVDLTDLAMLLGAFGSCAGDPGFVSGADFDDSGCIDLADLSVLLGNFGS